MRPPPSSILVVWCGQVGEFDERAGGREVVVLIAVGGVGERLVDSYLLVHLGEQLSRVNMDSASIDHASP